MCDDCRKIDGEFKVTGTFSNGSVAIRIESEGLPTEAITYGLLTAASELVPQKDSKSESKPTHDDLTDAQAESFADFIMDKLFGEVWRKSPANKKAKEPATASA